MRSYTPRQLIQRLCEIEGMGDPLHFKLELDIGKHGESSVIVDVELLSVTGRTLRFLPCDPLPASATRGPT